MTNGGVKTFAELAEYADARAKKSVHRNDPWAWAYWRMVTEWARHCIEAKWDRKAGYRMFWLEQARYYSQAARQSMYSPDQRARDYSRAKWCVILARNHGFRMNSKETGVSLDWLREAECVTTA